LIIAAGATVAMPVGAMLILLWVWQSATPWRDIGYVNPKSWVGTVAIGTLLGIGFKILMKAVVMPLLVADPVNHTYHYLTGDLSASLGFAIYLVIAGGWAEETVFRGYLFERLGRLVGTGTLAKTAIVAMTSAPFAALHYDQGWPGVEQAVMTGLVFGTIFAVTGRLFLNMVIHAAFDLTALTMIYFDVESSFGHLIFK
jgi:membrane protease YdiL (CAAX protease family)